ncbi:trifunctional serine/threonine-protein kinase/ATP-binding protein/sensor histidine kinase [Cupriavidus basilensis]|uniref:trifunctional serine/threonine-protein kinase/ATP-binding protein/sensor histidine kinase n=1 Tax=Cupriavidus basilensis TaxID=68895 RepID=UPI0028478B86|nr:AAA family ATPase [Cupriavidus basilensis]MDR3379649.1 AAA family ATPase [Cupriavidus basilensis]
MKRSLRFCVEGDARARILWKDGDRVLGRWIIELDGRQTPVLAVWPATERPTSSNLSRLTHEYGLKEELDGTWAARPLALVRESGRTALLLEDPGGEPLAGMLGSPMELSRFLRLAIGIAAALSQLHRRRLIHKDLKPAHILVNDNLGSARLTGFGLASRLARERHAPAPAEEITGTLAYMAPEQTGRMNRPIDARSDLYAFGVTLYQMLTGVLPFATDDPMGLVHCHLARQPMPPVQRIPGIPELLSDLVLRLLAKPAEERYQTAAGLEADLRRCLAEWEKRGRIDAFPLGAHDVPERPMTPSRLHGREREIQALLAAYDRVMADGMPELVLVSGYSGIGKTSVVHELRQAVVSRGGLFSSGKFDQFKRDIQYATLTQALQSLIRPLLGKSEAQLKPWRQALDTALGPNGALLAPLIPELELILGPQPPVVVLPPRDTQHRLHQVFQCLLGVFARAEHPLVLFLDDLQWLDTATLDLLAYLATQPEMRHLLLVGAYRSNEVKPSHPLLQRLSAIRQAGGQVRDVKLAPLGVTDIGRLIADALRCPPARVAALAGLVQAKTAGNPFFAVQFLTTLADEELLAFDQRGVGWSWDLEQILAKGFTENVADLMLSKLERLPEGTRDALQLLACLGNDAAIALLTTVHGGNQTLLEEALWPAMHAGLVVYQGGTCRFQHDRIQEAAYRLIPEGARPAAHLEIGRRLASGTPREAVPDRIFEIVGQLNRGTALIHTTGEREQVAELNLLAGERAKAATAYASALGCLAAGAALLRGDARKRRPELAFALDLHRAECEFLTGALPAAESRLADLADRASSLPDLAHVTQLQLELFLACGQRARAVEVGLDYLRRAGIQCPAKPDKQDVQQEYGRMWQLIGNRPIEALRDLPLMTDEVSRGTMDVLTALMLPAWYTNVDLGSLIIGRMSNLSLEHGNCDASCLNYAWLGLILGPQSGDYDAAFRFGQLGVDLVEQHGLDRFKARVYQAFGGHVMQWTRPIRTARSLVQRAFDVASKLGDLTYASFARNNHITQMLAIGEPLAEVQHEAEAMIDFAYKARFSLAVDRVKPQLQLVRSLRGRTPVFGSLSDAGFHEESYERYLDEPPGPTLATCWYWVRKLQARYLAGDYATALAAADRADRLLWTCPSFFEQAEYHFYAALAHAAHDLSRVEPERARRIRVISDHHRQLRLWAEHCPENFQTRAALVGAELARIEDRETDAMNLYEQAIRSARDSDFVHNEALANELAARFYAARGFEKIARVYLQDARHGYLRWGADGKVQQLDGLFPHLCGAESAPAPTATIGLPLERLDLATVIAVSQAISGEVVLDKLLDTLMRTALEQAGAERGVLVLSRGTDLHIVAEATTRGDAVAVQLLDESVSATMLPVSMLHYVLRARENIIVDNAMTQSAFADDPYIQRQHARSILCLPLLTQAKLIGALYLENNLAPRVFAPARTAVLKLLASQAATAIENAHLYRDLAQREAKIQRLLEGNFIGIFIWHLDGRILEANDAFLHMLGYQRDDLASASLGWADLTPPEWHARDARLAQEFRLTGSVPPPFEKEFYHKDGSRVPVLIGSASFEESEEQGVSFVLNLTERKRAEEALHYAQAQLAHVTRVTTLSALTASIAHEVNQPLAAIITKANSALRWLARQPPDLGEVHDAVESIVQAGHRAGSVIGGMRALFRKTTAANMALDLNRLIEDTSALVHCEVVRHQILVQTDLAADLPQVVGDRVQLQQVLLNLLMNGIEAMKDVTDRPRVLRIQSRCDAAGAALVAVHDTGIGLEPQAEERIFDGFYTTKPEGLGMGLTICRMIVEAQAGRLWASANTPFGAVFQFTLPPAYD